MKGQARLNQSRKLSVAQQLYDLENKSIGFSVSTSKNRLRWVYKTKPMAMSREYIILIDYLPNPKKKEHNIKVFVLSPDLSSLTSTAEKIPHIFEIKDIKYKNAICLCLFRSKYREWTEQQYISQTIIPWVDLWLFYFESWLITGVWEGGGEHPEGWLGLF